MNPLTIFIPLGIFLILYAIIGAFVTYQYSGFCVGEEYFEVGLFWPIVAWVLVVEWWKK